jgi:hypothetical protein
MCERIAVYTAMSGHKATINSPLWLPDYVDYFCFTDVGPEFIPSPWKIIPLMPSFDDGCRNAKPPKILPHRYLANYDISIWIDSNIYVTNGYDQILKNHILSFDFDMALFKHFERDCLYDEAEVCKNMRLDDHDVIDMQISKYLDDCFPTHIGLPECGIMIRRHTKDIIALMEFWWHQILVGSKRDQLSFMYSSWKMGMFPERIKILDITLRTHECHKYMGHLK